MESRKSQQKVNKQINHKDNFGASLDFKIYKTSPKYFMNGICIEVLENHNIEDIIEFIDKNREFVYENSSKRGKDWINISSNTIKSIPIS